MDSFEIKKEGLQEEKNTTRLQQEVDFLLRHVHEKTLVAEFEEDYVHVHSDGTIDEVRVHEIATGEKMHVFPQSKSSYAEVFRPITDDVVMAKETITEHFTKDKIKKGFVLLTGAVLYNFFKKLEY